MPFAAEGVQLEALDAARRAVSADTSNAGHPALVALARAMGCANPHPSTLFSIIAVLDLLEHRHKFASDREAWVAHESKERTFKTWKGRTHQLVMSHLVNEVEMPPQDVADFHAALSGREVREAGLETIE